MGERDVEQLVDNLLLLLCVTFCIFSITTLSIAVQNLKTGNNEIKKLKGDKVNVTRTWEQVRTIIFGRRATILDYFLPT